MATAVEIRMLLVHPQKPLKLLEAPRISLRGKRSISIVARGRRQRRFQTPEQALRRARPQDWVLHPNSGENITISSSSSSSSGAFLITIYLPIGVTREDFEFLVSRLPVERWLYFNPFAGFAFCECSTKLAGEEALEALDGFPVGEGATITAFLGSNDQLSTGSTDGSTAAEGQLWKHRSQTTKGRAPELWKKMILREKFGDWKKFHYDDHWQSGLVGSVGAAQDPNKSWQNSAVPQLWERQSSMISNSGTDWDQSNARLALQDSNINISSGAWQRESCMIAKSNTTAETWDAKSMNMPLQDADINNVHDNGMGSHFSGSPAWNPGAWARTNHANGSTSNSNTSTSPETWDQGNANINTSSRAWGPKSCMNLHSNTTPETWDARSMNMPLQDSDIDNVPQAWEHESRMGSHFSGSPGWNPGAWGPNHANESTGRAPETWEQPRKPERVNIREFWKKHNVNTIYWRMNRNPQPEGKFYGPWKPPKVVKPEDYQHLTKFAEIPELMVNGKPYRRSPTRRLFEMADRCPELWTNVALSPIWKINFKQAASSSEMSPKLWDLWRPACTTNAPPGIFREVRSQIYAYYRERHRRFPTWKMKPEEIKKHPKHKEDLLRYVLTNVGPFVQDLSFERLPWEKSHKWRDPKKSTRRLKLYETAK